MKIFLDFDNTLLNTRKIVQSRYKPFLEEKGIKRDRIEETMSSFSNGTNIQEKTFSVEKHLALLPIAEEDKSDILLQGKRFFTEVEEFLFPGTRQFLKNLSLHDIILLTFGDTGFQGMKIEASHLKEFCTEVCITEKKKIEEIVLRVRKGESFVFIDDHGEYFAPAKEIFGGYAHTIHMLHPESEKTCEGCQADFHSGDFESVTRYIQTICAE